jgi:hypothetical protein
MTPSPSIFSAPAPSPVESFDDRLMEEPEHDIQVFLSANFYLEGKTLLVIFVSVAHHAHLLFRS